MKTFKAYLAGPIAGLLYEEACDWRDEAQKLLPGCIECYSPMRGKEFLKEVSYISTQSYEEHNLASAHGIMGRDHYDVRTADVVLMYLLGAKRVSIGSVMEAAWCYTYRIPLIVVMEGDKNPHHHVMFNEIPVYRATTLAEGCSLACHLLLP